MTFMSKGFGLASQVVFNFLVSLVSFCLKQFHSSFLTSHDYSTFEDFRPDILWMFARLGFVWAFLTLDSGCTAFPGITQARCGALRIAPVRWCMTWAWPSSVGVPVHHSIEVLFASLTPVKFLFFTLAINSIWHEATLKLCKTVKYLHKNM